MTGFEQKNPQPDNYFPHQETTTYFLDAENIAEMARIELQSRVMTQGMGGTFPELDNCLPDECHQVLDLCCGTGEWMRQVAHDYPDRSVTGLDSSSLMLAYARATAEETLLANVHFLQGNVLDPLPFPDHSFDLVNARFLIGVLHGERWPAFLAECVRITRPGGMIRLTEGDHAGHSNKSSCEQFGTWAISLFHMRHYGFGDDPHSAGLTSQLEPLLQRAGCQRILRRDCTLDCSHGTPLYDSQSQNWRIAYIQMQPVLVRLGIATTAEIETMYACMLKELVEPDFQATTELTTVLGYTPPDK